jgi:hypothetical protein
MGGPPPDAPDLVGVITAANEVGLPQLDLTELERIHGKLPIQPIPGLES